MEELLYPKGKTKKKRKKHSKSIIQMDGNYCYICGKIGYTEEHHVFEGPNRKLSDQYGLTVRLCPFCHREDKNAAHKSKETAKYLHRIGQREFEKQCGTKGEFVKIFGKNYL